LPDPLTGRRHYHGAIADRSGEAEKETDGMFGDLQQLAQQLAGHADRGTSDQVPHQEAYQAYDAFKQQLTPEQIGQAAQRYYEQASPEQRAAMARQYQLGFQQQGSPLAQQWGNVNPQSVSPQQLGQMHQQAQQQHPDMLQQLFSPGGALGGTGTKLAVAGIAAMAAKQFLGGGI
jgi:hypothetical protein